MKDSDHSFILSVIIPTFNRSETLKKTLASLVDQTLLPDQYELIIVNDGSVDDTKDIVSDFRKPGMNIIYLEQGNRGPAVARNVAIKQARGSFILFTGDDIIASRGLLRAHLDSLMKNKDCAVLGFTQWDPQLAVSEFMEYIMKQGHQFDYNRLRDGQECPWGMFYTSNISLARSWLEDELFDEAMPYPIWEDSELGYRLTKRGLRIVFNKQAAAFHHHYITEEGFYNKTRQSGIIRKHFYLKHPELASRLYLFARTKAAFAIMSFLRQIGLVLRFFGLRWAYWELNICYYIILGIHDEMRKGICQKVSKYATLITYAVFFGLNQVRSLG
jgi:glycosyltransferase involved in cell wall biosynthesis